MTKIKEYMCRFVFIDFFLVVCFLMGCNTKARSVYDEIKPEFYKDYPGSTIIRIVPDAHQSLSGYLGYRVNLTITFKPDVNSKEETVVWLCFCHKDKGWIVENKSGPALKPVGTQKNFKLQDNCRKYCLRNYTYEVPLSWEMGDSAKEKQMEEMLSLDPIYEITSLSTFSVPEGAIVVVYEYVLPKEECANYIDKLYDLNVEKFKHGVDVGLVKKVLENRKTKQGNFDALLIDWESTRGKLPHCRQWILHHSKESLEKVAVIVVFSDDRSYKVCKEAIDYIASTINISGGDDVITIPLAGLPPEAKPLEMVLIPAGTFTMGSPSSERGRDSNEEPQHDVTITQPFYLGKYEVTQAQWQAVMGFNPARDFGVGNDYPVYYVSWNDCQSLIQNLNELGQGTFRLPTEAEWEYACRAGTVTRFSFGDALECADTGKNYCEIMDQYMWWKGNRTYSGEQDNTKEAGRKLPNPWGLYDMHGNCYEWCSDWYGSYPINPQIDPLGSQSGSYRVARGGDWHYSTQACRSASRASSLPQNRYYFIGLRLLRLFP